MRTSLEGERELVKEHHKQTGCHGDIGEYKDDDEVTGYYCKRCKEEWFPNSVNRNPLGTAVHQPVAHHIVPTFCCIQVSDTGNFVQWKNITEDNGGLKPGDHVAWLRPILGYWHHAIVETVNDDTIVVIEWSRRIHKNTRKKWDLCGNCCYSPMYKAYYSDEVLQQNPANVVLMRARARLEDTGYGLCSDNCEHFATFCKTGLHRSNQLHQLKVTLRAWVRRLIVSFFHLAIIVSFAETIERYAGVRGKHWLGAVLLVVSEMLYLAIVYCVIYRHDSKRETFRTDGQPECTRACKCSSIKASLQSMTAIGFAIIANVALLNQIEHDKWSDAELTGAEIGLGVAGGMVGNIVGFYLFAYAPYPCCRNEVTADD